MIDGIVLAHQGGWDEALFVLAPLALFAVLLLVARRRVDRMELENETRGDATDRPGDEPSGDAPARDPR